jgi:hypothetical protein
MIRMQMIRLAVRALLIVAFVALSSTIMRNLTDALTLAVGHVPPGMSQSATAGHGHGDYTGSRRIVAGLSG